MSPLALYKCLGAYGFYGMLLMSPLVIIGIHLLWLLLPTSFTEDHLKPPHFSVTEVAAFGAYPGKLVYSVVVGWMICFPNRNGRKRKLSNIRKLLPNSYQIYARIFLLLIMVALAGSMLLSLLISGVLSVWLPGV